MTTVPEHIKNLLFEQDCVVIPDFGGFIANFHTAALHANGSILPPRRRLAFNEVLKFDDGLLSSYVAAVEFCSREEALQRIRSFADSLKTEIRRKNHAHFGQLGSFSLNREGKLVFEPDDQLNFHAESYGFVPVFPKFSRKYQAESGYIKLQTAPSEALDKKNLILEPEIEEVQVLELRSKTVRRVPLTSLAAACGVLAICLIGYQFIQSGPSTTSSFNPADVFDFEWLNTKKSQSVTKAKSVQLSSPKVSTSGAVKSAEKEKISSVAPSTIASTNVRPQPIAPGESNEIKKRSTRFYVIVGGFKKIITANRLKRELVAKGYSGSSLVIPKTKGLIKVSVEDFDIAEDATALAHQVGKRFGAPAWVLKQKE